MKKLNIKVTKEWAGMGVDLALVAAGIGLSRRKIRKILDMGGISVDHKTIKIAGHKVREGELIAVHYEPESLKVWSANQFPITAAEILWKRHGVIALNKPPLLPSQPPRSKDAPHAVKVVMDFLATTSKRVAPLFLCHRLDKETSGVLLLAESEATTAYIMEQFKQKTVAKTYLALVHGLPRQEEWHVNCHLSPIDQKTGLVKPVQAGGKASRTRFQVIAVQKRDKIALIACYPETGRSHQIRVHLAMSGLPIVGDKKYAGTLGRSLRPELQGLSLSHHFLHAASIQFQCRAEDRQATQVNAELPPQFIRFLAAAHFQAVAMESIVGQRDHAEKRSPPQKKPSF